MFYLFAPLNIGNRLATGKNLEPLTQQSTVYLLNNYILSTGVVPVPVCLGHLIRTLGFSVRLCRESILFVLISVSREASDLVICTSLVGLHDSMPFAPTGPTS